MTLVNVRAAFEKAVTDQVTDNDPTVKMVYDNVPFKEPGKTSKYIVMTMNFSQSTLQNQGAASDYYAGVIQCNIYVPKNKGTSVVSGICEHVIDGLISVNCTPKVRNIIGPNMLQIEDRSHFIGIISCQFTANA